jgi:MYXO-CTERM domain-containing protein
MRNLLVILLIVALAGGCGSRPEQEEVEAQTLGTLNGFYRMHMWDNPSIVITNLEDLYLRLGRPYPGRWHDQFMTYGKHAGFSNSFFEKYVFFHPGSTNELAGGEIVFMNARPFPRFDGKLGRYALIKVGHRYETRRLSEDEVKLILKDDRTKLFPLGTISRPPRRPPESEVAFLHRVQERFFRVCGKCGLGVEATANAWRIVVLSPLLLFGLLGIWFWRSRRRRVR